MPLLLVLLLGMVDFGKMFNEWIDETHLANQGARLAAVGYAVAGCADPNPNVCLAQYIRDGANLTELKSGRAANEFAPGQNAARVCISYPTNPASNSSGQVGDPVEVTVNVTYRWLNYLSTRISLGDTGLQGKATMRLERRAVSASTTCYPAT